MVLSITPPENAQPGEYTFELKATSLTNRFAYDTVEGIVYIGTMNVDVEIDPDYVFVSPAPDTVVLDVEITNTGFFTDTYDLIVGGLLGYLTYEGYTWEIGEQPNVTLAPGETAHLTLTIPRSTVDNLLTGTSYNAGVTAVSRTNSLISDTDITVVEVEGFRNVTVEIEPKEKVLDVNESLNLTQIEFTVFINNTGNLEDEYRLTVIAPGIEVYLEESQVEVYEHFGTTVLVIVKPIPGPGVYNITIIATSIHNSSVSDSDTGTLIIIGGTKKNNPPQPNAGGPYVEDEGTEVIFDASGSTDPESDVLQFRWDFNSDGIWDTNFTTDPTASYTWMDDYVGDVILEITDGEFEVQTTAEVIINDLAPTADFKWSAGPYEEGSPINFTDLSQSYPDDLVHWQWDFAGLAYSTSQNPNFTFMQNGSFNVTLTVMDEDGSTHTVTYILSISDLEPLADFTWPPSVQYEGNNVQFVDQSYSYPDDITLWVWDFGDGTTGSIQNETHTYGDNGVFTVTLTVTDEDGSTDSISYEITVINVAPEVDGLSSITINEGEIVYFSGHATDPGSDDLTFDWTWEYRNSSDKTTTYYNSPPNPDPYPSPDLNPRNITDSASSQYGDNGVFVVTLTVTDDDGASTTVSTNITVNNVAPTVDPLSAITMDELETASFSGHATDPGSDDLTFEWTWQQMGANDKSTTYYNNPPNSDPSPSPELNPRNVSDSTSSQYGDNGVFNVTLTVTDDDGASVAVTTTVTVNNVAPSVDSLPEIIIDEHDSTSFTGHATDPGSDDLTFEWSWEYAAWGDKTTTYLNSPPFSDSYPSPEINPRNVTETSSCQFGDNGVFTVTLTVTDDDGASTVVSTKVTVNNVAPAIDPLSPLTIDEGESVSFTASATDPGSDDLTIEWTWEYRSSSYKSTTYFNSPPNPDQSPSPEVNPRNVTNSAGSQYGDNGVFTVTLTVTDDDGASSSVNTTITVNNIAPEVDSLSPLTIDEFDSATFTGHATDPGSDDITFDWVWEYTSWGDKTTAYLNSPPNTDPSPSPSVNPRNITETASCQYGDNGVFTVTLTVTDDDGASTIVSTNVTVNNVAPTVDALPDLTINEFESVTFTGHSTDPGSDDLIFEWKWEYTSWGDKTTTYLNNPPYSDPSPSPEVNSRDITETASCQYGDNGVFLVTLTVTDDDGSSAVVNSTVTVNNVAPTVDALPEITIDEYESVTFTGHATDPGSDDLTFDWTWDYTPWGDKTTVYLNNPPNNDSYPSPEVNPRNVTELATCQYGDNGIFTVSLTVTDDDGATTVVSTNVTVNNVAPTVDALPDVTIDEYESVTFTGHATDPGSDDLTFEWNWEYAAWGDKTTTYYNNGSTADPYPSPSINPRNITETSTCQYGDNGIFIVTLTVTDDDGATTTVSTNVTVNNVAPTVDALPAVTIDEYDSASFTGHATDPGSDDLTFEWTWEYAPWGDKTTTYLNNPPSTDPYPSPEVNPRNITELATCQYGDNGVFIVILTVTDDDGATTTVSTNVTVNNVAPGIEPLAPYTIDENSPVTVTGIVLDLGSDDLTITWDWGDGTNDTITTYYNNGISPDPFPSPEVKPMNITDIVSHIYGDNGVFSVTLTAEDDDGAVSQGTTNITVDNVAPTIHPFGPFTIEEGSPVDINATATDPGSDDLTFTWEFELGPTISNLYYNNGVSPDPYPSPEINPVNITDNVVHTYGDNWVYTLTLTVEDDDGGVAVYTTEIIVDNVAPTIDRVEAYIMINFTLRIAGEKWHDVQMSVYENDEIIAFGKVVRYPGNPDEQLLILDEVKCDVTKYINVSIIYTPEDDPVNGQPNGATPAWLIMTYDDGEPDRLKHTFNVKHPETWIWNVTVNPYILGHEITFEGNATDRGSDDLTFIWSWDDGTPDNSTIYYNDGAGPDPLPSPWGTYPVTVMDVAKHTYWVSGYYTVQLNVKDDDGGTQMAEIILILI
jgi:PKD repeat protein